MSDARLSPPCWLIERSHEPKWWTGGGAHGFTSDVSAAVRFNRRVDAERIINLGFIVDPAAFVSEHLWGDPEWRRELDADLSFLLDRVIQQEHQIGELTKALIAYEAQVLEKDAEIERLSALLDTLTGDV